MENEVTAIRNIPENYTLLTDTQETDAVRETIPAARDYDSFFVLQKEGDIIGLFGFCGTVAYLSKLAKRLI